MPSAIAVAVSAVTTYIGGITWSGLAVGALQTFALGAASRALAPKPKSLSAPTITNREIRVQNSIAGQQLVFGSAKVAGTLLYVEVNNNKQDLHIIIGLASNKQRVYSMYIGDEGITNIDPQGYGSLITINPTYNGKLKVLAMQGDDDQTLPADILNNTALTAADRFRGIAYVYIRMTYDSGLFPSGIPQFVFDVSSDLVDTPFLGVGATQYPNNPSVALYEYLTNARYGLSVPESEIDLQSFSDTFDFDWSSGFKSNGIIDLTRSPAENIQDLLSSNSAWLTYTGGKFSLIPNAPSSLGIDRPWRFIAKHFIKPSDIVGGFEMQSDVAASDKFNTVTALYIEPDRNYQPYETPRLQYAPYLAEDNGVVNEAEISLPFTIDYDSAQVLAFIEMVNARRKPRMSIQVNLKGCFIDVGDLIILDLSSIGLEDDMLFEVITWNLMPSENGNIVRLDLIGGTRYVNPASVPITPID